MVAPYRNEQILHLGRKLQESLATPKARLCLDTFFDSQDERYNKGIPIREAWRSGPCLCLALALREWLGKENTTVDVAFHLDVEGTCHALARVGDYYLDGDGIISVADYQQWVECLNIDNNKQGAYMQPFHPTPHQRSLFATWVLNSNKEDELVIRPLVQLFEQTLQKNDFLDALLSLEDFGPSL